MADRLFITTPSDLRYRDAVGALIQQICSRLRPEDKGRTLGFQVISAFNEAFNNLCRYAYVDQDRGEIEILLEIHLDELVIELRDEGRVFDFDSVEMPDLMEMPESGLGIFIIRSFMTEVEYRPGTDGAKNVLRMVRTLDELDEDQMTAKTNDPAQRTNIDA
jgi:anti-sigma regulatory factor (Ser/Thr protein kinase)